MVSGERYIRISDSRKSKKFETSMQSEPDGADVHGYNKFHPLPGVAGPGDLKQV
jgi:hypothetical protein